MGSLHWYNLRGEEVLRLPFIIQIPENELAWDMSRFPEGIYLMNIGSETIYYQTKVLGIR